MGRTEPFLALLLAAASIQSNVTAEVKNLTGRHLAVIPLGTDDSSATGLLLQDNLIALNETDRVALEGYGNLVELHLDGNRITRVSAGFFSAVPRLRILTLSGNQISSLDPGSFSGLKDLEELDLSHNQLTSVPAYTFEGLTRLKVVNLQENPWNCTSALSSSLAALQAAGVSIGQTDKCASSQQRTGLDAPGAVTVQALDSSAPPTTETDNPTSDLPDPSAALATSTASEAKSHSSSTGTTSDTSSDTNSGTGTTSGASSDTNSGTGTTSGASSDTNNGTGTTSGASSDTNNGTGTTSSGGTTSGAGTNSGTGTTSGATSNTNSGTGTSSSNRSSGTSTHTTSSTSTKSSTGLSTSGSIVKDKPTAKSNTWKFTVGVIVAALVTSTIILCAVKGPSLYMLFHNYRHRRLDQNDDGDSQTTVFSRTGSRVDQMTFTFERITRQEEEEDQEDVYYEDPFMMRDERLDTEDLTTFRF